MVSGPASPGSLLEMQNPRPSPGLLNQDLSFKNLKKNFLTTLHGILNLSSSTRDRTHPPALGAWSLMNGTSREVPGSAFRNYPWEMCVHTGVKSTDMQKP